MTSFHRLIAGALCAALACLAPDVASAQSCGLSSAGFGPWLAKFRQQSAAAGIGPRGLAALDGLTYDGSVIARDRGQKSFKLSFEEFYARRVGTYLITKGRRMMQQHAAVFDRIDRQFGVPREILTAIWGLETNFGADGAGKYSVVRSVATLAYDCRRSDFFRNELDSALRIIDRGDMTNAQMVGGWAGEIGQVQFLPSSYYKYAVDFDGDGRRDLVHSIPDMLASTANFLKSKGGWQRGQTWGPGTANYTAIKEWNKAEVYQRTIAVMADKLAGR